MDINMIQAHAILVVCAAFGVIVFRWVTYRIKIAGIDDHLYYLMPLLLACVGYVISWQYDEWSSFLVAFFIGGIIKTMADLILLVLSWISHVPSLRLPMIKAPHE